MLIFCHIPKCGGMTLQYILRRNFGEAALRLHEKNRQPRFFTEAEKVGIIRRFPQAQSLTSHHASYPFPGTHQYVTFLRHPVKRLHSLYRYERQRTLGTDHPSQYDILTWAQHRFNGQANHQIAFLCAGQQPSLEGAQAVCEVFDLVGLVERYDLSLVLLREFIDQSLDIRYFRQNKSRPVDSPLSSVEADDYLRTICQQDLALYEWAALRLAHHAEAVPDCTRQVSHFQRRNARFQRLRQMVYTLRQAVRRVIQEGPL